MFATIKREFGHLDCVFVNAGNSVFLPFEDMTEQSFDKVISVEFQRGLLHDSKGLAAPQARFVCNHQCVGGARKGWPTTSVVSSSKAALVHLARILSAELVDRSISREYPKPRPDGHGDVPVASQAKNRATRLKAS